MQGFSESDKRGIIKVLAQQTGEFECLKPSGFVSKYLKLDPNREL